MNRPEEALQRIVVQFLWAAIPDCCWWTAIPNQRGTRKRYENEILAAMGVRAGAPDLIFVWCGQLLGIELKSPTGRPSPAQCETRSMILDAGGSYVICRDLDQVADALKVFGVPLKVEPIRRDGGAYAWVRIERAINDR